MRVPLAEIKSSVHDIEAGQNWTLSATCFRNEKSSPQAPVVLISSAAAMPRGFYAAFAQHLAASGAHAVVIYDYRGIVDSAGDQARWHELTMRDWALLDFPALANWCKDTFPTRPLVGLGHSYGGQALGLCGCSALFERYMTVATQSGHWRLTDEPLSVWVKTQIIGKFLAKLLGHIPAWAGFGLKLPGGIFLEWAKWVNTPDYFMSDPNLPEVSRYKDVNLPLLSLGLTDDTWGTEAAVSNFMLAYENAELRRFWLDPIPDSKIGHFRFFRPENKDHCWPIAENFMLRGEWPEGLKESARKPD